MKVDLTAYLSVAFKFAFFSFFSIILANSFDIEARYPYLDEPLISVCAALKEISRKEKREKERARGNRK